MHFALPESRRLSDKEPPWKHRMLRWLRHFGCKRFFGGSRYSSARTTEASAAKWPLTFTRRNIMKSIQTLNFVKFAACMVLVVGLSASASASCSDSLSAMAAAAASYKLNPARYNRTLDLLGT